MQLKMKTPLLVLLLLSIVLSACYTGPDEATATTAIVNITNTPPPNCVDPTVKILSPRTELLAQDEIRIAADADGDNISYSWTAVSGTIENKTEKVITYVAPDNVTNDTINLTISSDCGSTTAALELTITPSTATPKPSATSRPTHTPSPTHTSTVPPTNTRPSFTQTPIATEFPEGIPSVNLAEPKDATCVGGASATFKWEWDWSLNDVEGPGGDYFALNIWSPETQARSATWLKERSYIVNHPQDPIVVYTQEVDCTQEKGCFWNVDVIRANVPPGQGHLAGSHSVIARSPIRSFCVNYSDNGLFTKNPPKDTPVPTTSGPQPTPTIPDTIEE